MNRLSFYVKLPAQWQTQPDKNYSFHVGDYPLQPVDEELPPADPQQEGRHFYYWQRLFGDDDGDSQPGWQRIELNLVTQHSTAGLCRCPSRF